MRRAAGLPAWTAWILLLAAACASPAAPAPPPAQPAPGPGTEAAQSALARPPTRVVVVYTSPSGAQAPVWVAKDWGFFDKYGLDAEVRRAAPNEAMAAVIAGEVQFAISSPDSVFGAVLGGADITMLGSQLPYMTEALVARPDIRTPADLRGKSVGITRFGSSSDAAARITVERFGLDPHTDVTYVQMPDVPTIIAGVDSGSVQAGIASPPNTLRAKKLGLVLLVDLMPLKEDYPLANHLALTSYVRAHPEVAEAYLKAFIEANMVYRRDREAVVRVFRDWAKVEDSEVAYEAFEYAQTTLNDVPRLSLAGLKRVADLFAQTRPEVRDLDFSRIVDNSYLERLEASGFVDQLQARYR